MARARPLALVFLLIVAGFACSNSAQSASCNALVGKWAWFIGGEVTINADGTFTQQSGNSGTWTCTDASKGAVTLTWAKGGFVNKMILTEDHQACRAEIRHSRSYLRNGWGQRYRIRRRKRLLHLPSLLPPILSFSQKAATWRPPENVGKPFHISIRRLRPMHAIQRPIRIGGDAWQVWARETVGFRILIRPSSWPLTI